MSLIADAARTVRQQVSMSAIVDRYIGGRSGKYIACPFHAEQTPSMRLYDDTYHCFGCGAHGDVTDFVAELYNLSPTGAINKLSDDFGLNLSIGARPTLSQIARVRRANLQADAERARRTADIEQADVEYYGALDDWIRWDRQLEDNRPAGPSCDFSSAFVEAARHVDEALDALKDADARRCAVRWRHKQQLS